jgi:hypothetical protein
MTKPNCIADISSMGAHSMASLSSLLPPVPSFLEAAADQKFLENRPPQWQVRAGHGDLVRRRSLMAMASSLALALSRALHAETRICQVPLKIARVAGLSTILAKKRRAK